MSNAARRADFLTGILRTAMFEGWNKEEFLRDVQRAWEILEEMDDAAERAAHNTRDAP